MKSWRWIIAGVLIVLGLQRYVLHYMGTPAYGWYLGPLTHVFTFGSSLSSVRMVAELPDGKESTVTFLPEDWRKGQRGGFFVRRAILSALMGTEARVPPVIQKLRQKYICDDPGFLRQFSEDGEVVAVQFFWKDGPDDVERLAARVHCKEGL